MDGLLFFRGGRELHTCAAYNFTETGARIHSNRLRLLPINFYVTFDNVEVGRMQAREVVKARPAGNYVFIKGAATDPNSDFLHGGQLDGLSTYYQS